MFADYDKPGFCIVHGEPLFHEKVINNNVKKVPKPCMTTVSMLLNDGSLMRVLMCNKAKSELTGTKEEYDQIMDRVKKGWLVETNKLVKDKDKPNWTKDYQDSYLKEYNKKEIIDRIDDLPIRTLEGIDREIVKLKTKRIKEYRDKLKQGNK